MKTNRATQEGYVAYPPPMRSETIRQWAYDEFKRIESVLRGITEPAWDDLLGASIALRQPSSDAAQWDDTEVAIGFSGTANQRLLFSHQFTHRWWEEDPVRPHLHIYQSTTAASSKNVCVFEMRYKWYNNGDQVPTTYTYTTALYTFTEGSSRTAAVLIFPEIQAPSKKVSSIFKGEFWRLATNGSDTYTATVYLDYQDIHLRVDSRGSYEEYTKGK